MAERLERSFHFELHQMQHFSPVSSFTHTDTEAARCFVVFHHLFRLVTPFSVTLSPLSALSEVHCHLRALSGSGSSSSCLHLCFF